MVKQLLLCKRLFTEGANFAERMDPISSGVAISLFQDSTEMCVWALIKEKGIPVKDTATFTSNLETLKSSGVILSHIAKILELNKARVGFKHYGNLPDSGEAAKFQTYVEDFLTNTLRDHFDCGFDSLSLADLISDQEIQSRIKAAENLIQINEFQKAAVEAAIAKAILFSRLAQFIPSVDRMIRDVENISHMQVLRSLQPEISQAGNAFRYLADYLELLRDATFASLLRLPLQDFAFLQQHLPGAFRLGSGEWQIGQIRSQSCEENTIKRTVSCLINLAIRLESIG